MILSHARQFIFIKTPKSASTSVEVGLSAMCGPMDIITPVGPEKIARSPDAQNYLRGEASREMRPDGLLEPLEECDFYNHMPLSRIAEYVGDDIAGKYLKVAFVRNPWDRQVSLYHFLKHQGHLQIGFAEWLTWAEPLPIMDMFRLNGTMAIDFVGRYEALQADFDMLCHRLGVAEVPLLPRLKSGLRPQMDYRDCYDARTRARVADMYAEEIATFGYAF
jgi:Sulfotransferase family